MTSFQKLTAIQYDVMRSKVKNEVVVIALPLMMTVVDYTKVYFDDFENINEL